MERLSLLQRLSTYGSQYLHASIHRFSPVAVAEISRRFRERATAFVEDPVTHPFELCYDEEDEMFAIGCRAYYGSRLDEILRDTITTYVAEDAAEAERRETQPHVYPFPENFVHDFLHDDLDDAADRSISEHDQEEGVDASEEHKKARIAHVVEPDTIEKHKKVKLFRLCDVSSAVPANHALSSIHGLAPGSLKQGLTLRSVRWDDELERHVFNGRKCEPVVTENPVDFELLVRKDFSRLFVRSIPRKKVPSSAPTLDSSTLHIKEWTYAGHKPTVQQWLAGVGDTVPVNQKTTDEESSPSVVTPTKSVVHETTDHTREASLDPLKAVQASNVSSRKAVTQETRRKKGFAALLGRSARDRNSSGDSESEASSSSASISQNDEPAKGRSSSQSQPGAYADELALGLPSYISSLRRSTSPRHETELLGSEQEDVDARTGQHFDSFPSYGNTFAKVDTAGLVGSPAAQAAWELQNLSTPSEWGPATITPVRRRALYDGGSGFSGGFIGTPSQADVFSTSHNQAVLRTRQNSISGSARSMQPSACTPPQSYSETVLGGEESWANNLVKASGPENDSFLIDDKVPKNDGHQFPSLPPPGRKQSQRPVAARPSPKATQNSTRRLIVEDEALVEENLIDLSDPEDRGRPQPLTTLPSNGYGTRRPVVRLPLISALTPTTPATRSDDTPLIEILETSPGDHIGPMRRTMGQRARSKNKNSVREKQRDAQKQSSGRVEMPKPDPAPPPKAKRTVVSSGIPFDPNEMRAAEDPFEEGVNNEPSSLQKQLCAFMDSGNQPLTTAEVRFGIISLRQSVGLASQKALTCALFEDLLNLNASDGESTDFLPQKLNSRSDVNTLWSLNLPFDSDSHPVSLATLHDVDEEILQCTFKIEIENNNRRWIVLTRDLNDFELRLVEEPNVKASIFFHVPQRVWDARIDLRAPIRTPLPEDEKLSAHQALVDAVGRFVSSLVSPQNDTDELEWLDFEGVVPSSNQSSDAIGNFVVLSFSMRFDYTETLGNGTIKWCLSKTRELRIESPLDFPEKFDRNSNVNFRAVGPREGPELRPNWWEAGLTMSLLSDGQELYSAEFMERSALLEKLLQTIVPEMDCIGAPPSHVAASTSAAASVSQRRKEKKKKLPAEAVPYW